MSADLNRRNFLKGMMAAAGVAAVGIPTLAAVAEVVEAAPEPVMPFPGDQGDIFMKVNGVWRFVCRARSLSIQHHVDEIDMTHFGGPPILRYSGLREYRVQIQSYFDKAGQQLLHDAFMERYAQEMAVGLGFGTTAVMRGVIAQMQIQCSHSPDMAEIETEFVASGAVQTFSAPHVAAGNPVLMPL